MDQGGEGGQIATEPSCTSCGTQLPPDSRFCNRCGAAVANASRSTEYKQVTVLFADVVRSMEIAATLDMERLREIMTEVVEDLAAVARRYGGTVEYSGDGVMAIFGAPTALEDHAFRACLAAVAIQEEIKGLAAEVSSRDGVALQLRVGVNSGRVIAGELGSGTSRYAATGETVGFAQRMESAAPPGGVMVSEATASLIEHVALLAEPELVRIKGSADPVAARRLVGIGRPDAPVGRAEASLVGRRWEMAALEAMLERAGGRRGGVVNVVGKPGIGKSRLAREAAALAGGRGTAVYWGFCESHARDVPFHAVTGLLRSVTGVAGLDSQAARDRVRQQNPHADPQDLLLFDDLLGIADPNMPPPQMDPDVRRRRLTELVNGRALARDEPALFVIEDAHWIDAVSESMLADFLEVIPRTASTVLITSRPEYAGALRRVADAQTIELAPLGDSQISALLTELLGSDPSVVELAALIAERSAGNPFFVEEIVRDLAQRGVLTGERGGYTSSTDLAEVTVPATVQAAIAARIDRLSTPARRTLNTASVIGARFKAELLVALGVDGVLDELLRAELVDQVDPAPNAEYAFAHPLIRAVAYESQLNAARAESHRRLADAIRERAAGSEDENAALIAEHLEAAGELRAAYDWHMRAGAWSANRDLAAARVSWERARRIADVVPEEDPEHLAMRIAPRTMLCATDWQAREVQDSRHRFEELRELCTAAGDKVSLAIGMSALATELVYAGRSREGARLSSEQMALLESIGDLTRSMALVPMAFVNWLCAGEFGEIMRWSQTVVDLAAGDPGKGAGFGLGSPLAIASAWRGTARWWSGHPDWQQDLFDAVAMAQRSNAETLAGAVAWTYGFAMQYGVLRPTDAIVDVAEEALQAARRASSDRAMGLSGYTLAVALLNRDSAADRDRGLDLMMQTRAIWLRKRAQFLIPVTDVWVARETARLGDRDAAIAVMRSAVDKMHTAEDLFYGVWGAGVLVETLLDRGDEGDLADAQREFDRLEDLLADHRSAMRDIWLLRLRALLARAREDVTYPDLVARYREMAESLGFEGHIAWADALVE